MLFRYLIIIIDEYTVCGCGQVVMSFWKAIGGDEEEIQGSSDSDS